MIAPEPRACLSCPRFRVSPHVEREGVSRTEFRLTYRGQSLIDRGEKDFSFKTSVVCIKKSRFSDFFL